MGVREWMTSFEDAVIRMQFGANQRIELYDSLGLLLENRVLLNDALKELYALASEDGKKLKDPVAIILHECLMGVAEGLPLSKALQKWIPPQEASLIAAGEKAGNLPRAFVDIIRIITAQKEIRAAVMMATAYPTLLIALACYLLNMVASDLVPKLSRTTDPETWTGAAATLYSLASYVNTYGLVTLIGVVLFLVGLFGSMPYLRGSVRIYLDRMAPYSIYRMLHGSTFLLNVAVLLQAGVKLQDALQLLSDNASPWLRERLDAARYGTGIGGNLGVALHRAGYEFPDRRAVRYLMILASRDGFEDAIRRFGDRWLKDSIKQIKAAAGVMLAAGVIAIGGLMILIVSGAGGIQDAMQASQAR